MAKPNGRGFDMKPIQRKMKVVKKSSFSHSKEPNEWKGIDNP